MLGLASIAALAAHPAAGRPTQLGPIHLVASICSPTDPNWANRDDDGDGVCNGVDVCPYEYNPPDPLTGVQDASACAMKAITVPANPASPAAPHVTYSGAMTTLKGIGRYGGDQFKWEFGDGSTPMPWTAVSDPYNLSVDHVYTGSVGQLFTATLSLRTSGVPSVVATANYAVKIVQSPDLTDPAQMDVRAQMAAEESLWWLHVNQSRLTFVNAAPGFGERAGFWSTQPLGSCMATDAFEIHGSRPQGAYSTDPYVEDVQRSLNFLLSNSYTAPMAVRPRGTADLNGNGIGIAFFPGGNLNPTDPACLLALADSDAPTRLASTGPQAVVNTATNPVTVVDPGVLGRSYKDIVQDAAEYVAWAQNDAFTPGLGAVGAWGFKPLDGDVGDTLDQEWEPLALSAAASKMGATIPTFVRQLEPNYFNSVHHTALDYDNGAYGYVSSASTNTYLGSTAEGVIGDEFVGETSSSPDLQAALGFFYRRWNDNNASQLGCYTANLGYSRTMYGVMQAMQHASPAQSTITDFNYVSGVQSSNSFDWYYSPAGQVQQGYASNLISRQRVDGSWTDSAGCGWYDQAESTAAGTMILLKGGAASGPSTPVLAWTPAGLTYGQALSSAQLDASATDSSSGAPVGGIFTYTPAAGTQVSAGVQTLSVSFAPTDATTYRAATGTVTIQVARATPTIGWPAPSAIGYGTALGSAQLDATASVAGSLSYSVDDLSTSASGNVPHSGDHTLYVSFTPTDTADYVVVNSSVTLHVNSALLVVTAQDQSRTYGAPNPALSVGYSGFVNGDGAAVVTGAPALTTALPSSGVGVYPIAVAQGTLTAADYSFTFLEGSLTVTPAPLTISADNQTKVYGAPLPTLTASYSGFVNGDDATTLSVPPVMATGATTASHINGGPYAITASGAAASDYTISYTAGTLAVVPAALAIAADSKIKVYGAALPVLSLTYTGFVNGDSANSLTTAPTLTTAATAASHVAGSPYLITASGASDADYTIGYAAGELTVTPAWLTITADDRSKAYGADLPALTPSYSGFVSGDTAAALSATPSLTTSATAASHVAGSPYIIMASGAADPDYAIVYNAGLLTVTPVPLSITADNQTKGYGSGLPNLTASYAGLVNGDTPSSLTAPTLVTAATAGSHVAGSPYAITASGAMDDDYTFTFGPGALTVTPVPLTITADSQTKVYGAALPSLSASFSGLLNGDTPASLASPPALTTTATAASHVAGSPYSITASTAVDSDYTIGYIPGALTVTTAPLTIRADDQTEVYGAALPTLTASYDGLVNGDTPALQAVQPTLATFATAASHVAGSPYAIRASGAADSDYAIAYTDGALIVTPAPLTITAADRWKVYGALLPGLGALYSGFVNGDTAASLAHQPSLATAATAASHVTGSPYAITASAAADTDYAITYATGKLTVTPAPLTITADNQIKAYGAALPTLTASYGGFVNSDSSGSLATAPRLASTATAATHVEGGPYAIAASGAVDPDYAISYVAGTLTVSPVALIITADSKSKLYGAPLPVLTAAYAGLVNSDTPASLQTPLSLSTTATTGSHVAGSPYGITAAGAADSDYVIEYVAGTLTIMPSPLLITANNQTKVYAAPLPVLTASYSGLVSGDTAASLTSPVALTTTARASSDVGAYSITASGATSTDYAIAYAAGTLSVTPAPLNVVVDNATHIYHQPNPTFTGTVTGVLNGDTITAAYSTALDASAAAGSYPDAIIATLAGAHLYDYSVTVHTGSLTVTQMPTTLAFSKAAFTVAEGSPAKITAVMTEALAPNGVIVGATVTCTLSSGQTVTAVTDGTATATCTLSGLGNGQYSVSAGFGGDHNYLSSSAATEPLFVYQPTTFVIWGGNQPKVSDAIRAGMDVNFWGAKWTNQVTAGAWFGGAGFKGFADTASATTWSVTGGSAKPPATIGQYIGVIVTTSATQSGSTTNGNIAELIVLKSDDPAGYKATPGQPANGIVQVVIS